MVRYVTILFKEGELLAAGVAGGKSRVFDFRGKPVEQSLRRLKVALGAGPWMVYDLWEVLDLNASGLLTGVDVSRFGPQTTPLVQPLYIGARLTQHVMRKPTMGALAAFLRCPWEGEVIDEPAEWTKFKPEAMRRQVELRLKTLAWLHERTAPYMEYGLKLRAEGLY